MSGATLIAAERDRQVAVEEWTPEHDAQYTAGELSLAALGYLKVALSQVDGWIGPFKAPANWPWDQARWKSSPYDPVPNLVKAGALIAAEIDRLQALKG